MLHGMSHILEASKLSYDVVSGVSTGAINAGAVVLFPIGEEKEMSEWLVDLWESLTTDKIYKQWAYTILRRLFRHSGILDNTPLLDLLSDVFKGFPNGIQKKVIFTTIDAHNGQYVTFNESMPIE